MDTHSNPSEAPVNIPVDSSELQPTPGWASVEAKKEDADWSTLDQQKLKNDKGWLKVYGMILVVLTCVFAGAFVLTLLAWIFHYIAPTSWHWLCSDQLSKIQSILFSGGMGAVIDIQTPHPLKAPGLKATVGAKAVLDSSSQKCGARPPGHAVGR